MLAVQGKKKILTKSSASCRPRRKVRKKLKTAVLYNSKYSANVESAFSPATLASAKRCGKVRPICDLFIFDMVSITTGQT